MNVMVPVGVLPVTVAVKVTAPPGALGFTEETSVVELLVRKVPVKF